MQRHLTQYDVNEMTEDTKKLIFNSQIKTYQHVQNQSQKFFRTLLAGAAIIIGLAWSKIFQTVASLEGIQQLLSSNFVFQNGVARTAPGIIDSSFQVGAYLMIVAVGLLFEAGITSIWIMKIDGPLPSARRKDIVLEELTAFPKEGLIDRWILINDRRVTEALLKLNQCYTSVWLATIVGILAISLMIFTVIGALAIIGVLHILVLLGGLLGLVYFVKNPTVMLIRGYRAGDLSDVIGSSIHRFLDSFEYVGPSGGMKLALFLIYSSMWEKSLNILQFWIEFPS